MSSDNGSDLPEGEFTIHDLAAPYVLNAVDDLERARFERHLVDCETCRASVAELAPALEGLTEEWEEQPPPQLRERLLSQVAEDSRVEQAGSSLEAAEGDETLRGSPTRSQRRSEQAQPRHLRSAGAKKGLMAAAAAAVIVIGGGTLVNQAPWEQDTGPAPVAVDEVLEAQDAQWSTESVGESTVHVVRSESAEQTAFVAEDMPPAPEGQDYQLWFVHEDGAAVSAGLMPASEEDRSELLLEGDPEGAVAVGVTVEPEGGSEQPTSDPLVAIPLSS